jgi:hypothetical protein
MLEANDTKQGAKQAGDFKVLNGRGNAVTP